MLRPNVAVPPFDCSVYPPPLDKACVAEKQAPLLRYSAPGSCSRLPPQFQAQCRALEPQNPRAFAGHDYDPRVWPNTRAPQPARFARAREACSALRPPQFYNCLWTSVSPASSTTPLVNAAYSPCPESVERVWIETVAPTFVAHDGTTGMANEPKTWRNVPFRN